MGWIVRIRIEGTGVDRASSLLWDRQTTGIADLGPAADAPGTGLVDLIAGFDSEAEANEAASALRGDRGCGVEPVVPAVSAVVEPIDPRSWIDDARTARVELDPTAEAAPLIDLTVGGAFGDGGHPTTTLALALLAMAITPGADVLDFGTGTGILALAAATYGARSILAVDNDPIAVEVATANLDDVEREHGATITIATDLAGGRVRRHDVIAANVLLAVHREVAADLAARLASGGALVLSGVLVEQEAEVLACYHPLTVEHRLVDQDWLGLILRAGPGSAAGAGR